MALESERNKDHERDLEIGLGNICGKTLFTSFRYFTPPNYMAFANEADEIKSR